jgi:tRNA 5-methylaminomethyl-2-thiouridine biosynthesis bifunctional protein
MVDLPSSPVIWDEDGQPRSRLYDDVYHSRDGGLAEARAVFLEGCDLPAAWAGQRRFCVGELGFGAGLNIAALLDCWRRERPKGGRLSVFSVEAHPLSSVEGRRALAAWPELEGVAALLVARWPGRARGFHRIDLPELNASVDLAVMEAAQALRGWSGAADAWFLDGFAPAKNPDMWRREVIELVAARSAAGARLSTYTVAGAVRRELVSAGFTVEKKPGFGRKKQRLRATMAGEAPTWMRPARVAIVGAGIAGAALARGFRGLGVDARVMDWAPAGSGASGAPAGLVSPRLDAGLGPQAALFAQAFNHAQALYESVSDAIIARGAVQLEVGAKDPARFAKIAASDLFEPGAMRRLAAVETTGRLGEPSAAGLLIERALVVEPARLLAAWLGRVERAEVADIQPTAAGWRLCGPSGATLAEAEVVCLAAGMGSMRLAPQLPLLPVRGQATVVRGVPPPPAALFGGYAIPTRDGLLFGATHDRDDARSDVRDGDNIRNLESLAAVLPALAARAAAGERQGWAGVRATTGDYLPLAGAVPDAPPGLFVLSGLGSRGFTLAPLLGEHVAAQALGFPSPLPAALAALVDPGRFAAREFRRAGGIRSAARRPRATGTPPSS